MNVRHTWPAKLIAIWLSCIAAVELFPQAEQHSSIEAISADPDVLHIEIFVPHSDSINIGPNLAFGEIDGKPAVFTQLGPKSNRGSDFILRRTGISWDIAFRLVGASPPYKIEFEQSLSPAAQPKKSQQTLEFPVGKLTRARLFDTFDVVGFYGNPQQQRP